MICIICTISKAQLRIILTQLMLCLTQLMLIFIFINYNLDFLSTGEIKTTDMADFPSTGVKSPPKISFSSISLVISNLSGKKLSYIKMNIFLRSMSNYGLIGEIIMKIQLFEKNAFPQCQGISPARKFPISPALGNSPSAGCSLTV